MVNNNKGVAWVAVIALILAVVAVAVVLKGSVTGNVIKDSSTSFALESYLMKATNFKTAGNIDYATIQYKRNGNWVNAKIDAKEGDVITIGNLKFLITSLNKVEKKITVFPQGNSYFQLTPMWVTFDGDTDNSFIGTYVSA